MAAESFAPRNRMERTLVALTRPMLFGGYCSGAWPDESLAVVAGIFRRAKAKRRRGTGTKAGRRERERYYCVVLAPSMRPEQRQAP